MKMDEGGLGRMHSCSLECKSIGLNRFGLDWIEEKDETIGRMWLVAFLGKCVC